MRALGGLFSTLGVLQLLWVFYVVVDASLHMGSPLLVHGQNIVSQADPQLGAEIQGMLNVGHLGFELLSDSILLLGFSGLVSIASGIVLVTRSSGLSLLAFYK
jgi:hypothetical protein